MSANLIVDIGNTCYAYRSLVTTAAFWQSGIIVGDVVDMLHANTFTNLALFGALTGNNPNSGQIRVGVQTADTTNSGDFTDPTSGMAAFPTVFESGGIVRLNSGSVGVPAGQQGTFGAFISGHAIQSGFTEFAGFQRPGRYARIISVSGPLDFYQGPLILAFVSQLKTTGSGGGFTLAPSSGVVNV